MMPVIGHTESIRNIFQGIGNGVVYLKYNCCTVHIGVQKDPDAITFASPTGSIETVV